MCAGRERGFGVVGDESGDAVLCEGVVGVSGGCRGGSGGVGEVGGVYGLYCEEFDDFVEESDGEVVSGVDGEDEFCGSGEEEITYKSLRAACGAIARKPLVKLAHPPF